VISAEAAQPRLRDALAAGLFLVEGRKERFEGMEDEARLFRTKLEQPALVLDATRSVSRHRQ
jgi:hypothetical protein